MWRIGNWAGLLLLLITTHSFAGQFEKGAIAADKGDYATAVKLWMPLAKHGDAKAQFNLGIMYHKGLGVKRDDRETEKWWRKAAERGYATAQTNLGNMYQYGLGVPPNYKEAAKWYRHAADKGDVNAEYNIGFMYLKGIGVAHDNKEAMHWFRRAADRGDIKSRFYMGYMFEQGQGVRADRVAAYALYSLLETRRQNGSSLALTYREHLTRRMTPTAIKEARALAPKLLRSKPMTKALDAYLASRKRSSG